MVGGAAYVGKKAGERSAEKKAADQQPEEQAPEPQEQSPAAEAEPDYMTELQQLAKLRDQGVITPEEFEAKKKAILGI